jgi:translocation and assembly module TamB
MKRWILAISVLSLCFILTLAAFAGWLLNTTSGAVWLLETVASDADLHLDAGHVEGRLADDLIIDDLVFAWSDGQVSIHRIHLNWDPFSAFQQNLKIHLLEIDQLAIKDFSPDEDEHTDLANVDDSESLAGFSVNDLIVLPEWLTLEIADLQFKGLSFEDLEGSVTIIDSFSGSFVWSQQQITSSAFNYLSPFVDFKGLFEWDLQSPHLEMVADVHLPADLIDHQIFKDIDVPVDFPGVLSLDGDWNDFSGPVSFGTETENFSKVWLAADAQGSWQGIDFDNLKAHYLGGSLAGKLELWWIDYYRMNGKVTGSDLNPGFFLNDLEGLATLDIEGELFVPYDETPLKAKITTEIMSGQLRNTNVSGDIALAWQDGDLYEIVLDLTSEDSRLSLQGRPSERLDVDASVKDLGSVYAGFAGRLNTSGWLRWRDGYLTGDLSGSGSDIVWQGASLERFNYHSRHLTEESPIDIVIDGEDFQHDLLQSDNIHAEVSGTIQKHDLFLTLNDQTAELNASLSGRYLDESWSGQLLKLTGKSSVLGSWSLNEPSNLAWIDGSFTLENFVLEGLAGGYLALEVIGAGTSTDSSISIDWSEVKHDWLKYLHPPFPVSGKSSGQFTMNTVDYQPVSLKARMSGNLSLQNPYSPLEIPSISIDLEWLDTGLDLELVAETEGGEHFEVKAASSQPPDLRNIPEQLSLAVNWQDVDLDRLSPLLEGVEVQGSSVGSLDLEIFDGSLQQAEAEMSADSHMQMGAKVFGFSALHANLLWDENNLQSEARATGVHGGLMSFMMTSTAAPDFRWPVSGDIELSLDGFDISTLSPFLNDHVDLVGLVHGHSSGYWRENGEISFLGQFGAVDDTIIWKLNDGQVGGAFKRADLDWYWHGANLEGQLALQLATGGAVQGRWQLPFSAHWPFDFKTDGPITAGLTGRASIDELMPFVASGVFQDMQGLVTSDLHISGTLKRPRFSGSLSLSDAGAYLPVTGTTIEDLSLQASLRDDKIHLDELFLKAGEGELLGTGLVEFDQWKLKGYRLELNGENLQLYNFPELQFFCSPDLSLTGDLSGTQLRGNILVTEMNLIDKTTEAQAVPSQDVVISGEERAEREKPTFDADIRVVFEIGDNVKVKTEGVETRLEGGVTIARDEKQHLAGWGEIRLVDGTYKAYGTSLEIKQGVMTFAGTPLTNPNLRVFAAKDVGRVQAGVHITGTAQNPVVTLASIPAMPERDILGYLFMGRAINRDSEGGDALTLGAGALIPNYGAAFSDYGIVELDLDGLLNDDGGVRLRRRLSESWEISSTLGTESGIDLFYILDFD